MTIREATLADAPLDERRACDGAPTESVWHNMEECRACEMAVRHDLTDHPFFGFRSSCPLKRPDRAGGC